MISRDCISKGGITAATVDVRLIFKRALEVGATAFLMAHNHPTGNKTVCGCEINRKGEKVRELLDIRLLDHLIVSENIYF